MTVSIFGDGSLFRDRAQQNLLIGKLALDQNLPYGNIPSIGHSPMETADGVQAEENRNHRG
jgi:hypothetical protein